MEKIRSLADQLREKMVKPAGNQHGETTGTKEKQARKKETRDLEPTILKELLDYDNRENKTMVHVRFDKKTVALLVRFKMATNIDTTKFVAFAVRHFFETHPELKTIIKNFIQNTEL